MATNRALFLLVTTLRQRAQHEAHLHYGRDLTKGLAGELAALADALERDGAAALLDDEARRRIAAELEWL